RHHEGGVSVRQRDAHAGADQRPLSRLEADGLRRDEVRAGVAGVRVVRHGRCDDGKIDGIAHPTRLMQNISPAARARYRERLTPSVWLLVAAVVVAPMVALTLVPVGPVVALVAGAAAAALLVAAMIWTGPVVSVEDGVLRAGRAHIGVEWLGEATPLTGEEA